MAKGRHTQSKRWFRSIFYTAAASTTNVDAAIAAASASASAAAADPDPDPAMFVRKATTTTAPRTTVTH